MLVIEQHILVFVLIILLLKQTIVHGIAGRCYLCSQANLAECAGNNQPDSDIYKTILQYYTEPCNGQCVLFRDETRSVIRGCSWTYGHMTPKSTGWHQISPGIPAYFCDSYLCNNGTFEEPQPSLIKTGAVNDPLLLLSNQLFLLTSNNPSHLHTGPHLSPNLQQCYSCTARFQGCGEFLDPHYASNYIRPCPSSCIIFRNPNDLNLITRDCSIFWPDVRAKNGIQKFLGTDAFLCQESLCNGINFDFIMAIYHNQSPMVIRYPSNHIIPTTTTSTLKTTVDIYHDNTIWDDSDLDFPSIESSTSTMLNNYSTVNTRLTTIKPKSPIIRRDSNVTSLMSSTQKHTEHDWIILNTSSPSSITQYEHLLLNDDDDDIDDNSEDMDDDNDDDDDGGDLYTSNGDLNSNINLDLNDYNLFSTLKSTPLTKFINNTNAQSLLPFNFLNKTRDELLAYLKFSPKFPIPPFSWMLSMIHQNKSQSLHSMPTTTTSSSTTTTPLTTITVDQSIELIPNTTISTSDILLEFCRNKSCHHGGRLNSDCLCLCLPAFTGENCETVICEQEPPQVCAFILEHECQNDQIVYLCPQFCQMTNCSSSEIDKHR